jgi:putative mRNA 3-end processing factor
MRDSRPTEDGPLREGAYARNAVCLKFTPLRAFVRRWRGAHAAIIKIHRNRPMNLPDHQSTIARDKPDLVVARPEGLYCEAGDFYIDPWRPVERAVITHAHSDHARFGHRHYLASRAGANVLLSRLPGISLQTLAYGERLVIGGATVSLHPAGHVLGSAQVRIEHEGRVWVASGDYKLDVDPTCDPFEPVRCDTFITESTFGLPIYRWDPPQTVFDGVDSWWRHNAAEARASVLFCYSFGKAQRVLASVDAGIGPIFCHGAVVRSPRKTRRCSATR